MTPQSSNYITNADLAKLLVNPGEKMNAEYKSWLDLNTNESKATLAKAICALANFGGGHIIVGLRSTDGGQTYVPSPNPEWATQYTADGVNRISAAYLEPAVHCEVASLPYSGNTTIVSIISVPGGSVPIILKKGGPTSTGILQGVYTRRADLSSQPPQTADEWRALLNRCVLSNRNDLLDAFRVIMSGGQVSDIPVEARDVLLGWSTNALTDWKSKNDGLLADSSTKIRHGYWWVCYQLQQAVPIESAKDLRQALETYKIRHTGWPQWVVLGRDGLAPYVNAEGDLECWLGRDGVADRAFSDPGHVDYWRYSKDGKAFLLRGFMEDAGPDDRIKVEPGSLFDVTLAIWRLGESLLHAQSMAEALQCQNQEAVFRIGWEGLNSRVLGSLSPGRYFSSEYTSRTDSYTYSGSVPIHTIADNLPEIVHRFLTPLCERFDMFNLSISLVSEELARMRKSRF